MSGWIDRLGCFRFVCVRVPFPVWSEGFSQRVDFQQLFQRSSGRIEEIGDGVRLKSMRLVSFLLPRPSIAQMHLRR
jgi:hypothetical protein